MLNSPRDQKEGKYRSGEGGGGLKARIVVGRGEEGPLCDPGSELLLGVSARLI